MQLRAATDSIGDLTALDDRLLVLNDNNFPFSAGRNAGRPDDDEAIVLDVPGLRDGPLPDTHAPSVDVQIVGLDAVDAAGNRARPRSLRLVVMRR